MRRLRLSDVFHPCLWLHSLRPRDRPSCIQEGHQHVQISCESHRTGQIKHRMPIDVKNIVLHWEKIPPARLFSEEYLGKAARPRGQYTKVGVGPRLFADHLPELSRRLHLQPVKAGIRKKTSDRTLPEKRGDVLLLQVFVKQHRHSPRHHRAKEIEYLRGRIGETQSQHLSLPWR